MSTNPKVKLTVVDTHRCSSRHRSAASFARCVFPAAVSVTGSGQFALVTCRPTGITLWATYARALEAKTTLDDSGCGRACTHDHEVVALDYDEPTA